MEPVSPELVLVDRALAERVQLRLREPDDTLARIEARVQASRRAALAQRSIEMPRPSRPRVVLEPARRVARVRTRRRRPAAFAGVAAAGMLTVGLLLGVRVDLAGNPAGADATVVDSVPAVVVPKTDTEQTETQPPPPPPARADPAPEAQRFAWAPVPGASGYHVELFLSSSRVFAADTARPAVTVPPSWKFAGRTRRLVRGEYRWYVWPVTSGRRAARAIVQARLTIPSS
jgi:hypothetical protein